MRYNIKHLIIFFLLVLGTISCKKGKDTIISNVAELNVINAFPGKSGLIVNINNQLPYYNGQLAISYGSFRRYALLGGNNNILIRDQEDTLTNIYSQNSSVPSNSIYSLFIAGNSETLLVADTIPYYDPQIHGVLDSVTGIRFVNLSTGSSPVSVNMMGNASGSEVASLDYKGITGFKKYQVAPSISSYKFEFHDKASDNLLANYTLTGVNNGINGNGRVNNVLFRNLTIALIGSPGSQQAVLISNY